MKLVKEARLPSWKVSYAILRIVALIVDALVGRGRILRREGSHRLRTYSIMVLYSKPCRTPLTCLQLTLLNLLYADDVFDSRFDLRVRGGVGNGKQKPFRRIVLCKQNG